MSISVLQFQLCHLFMTCCCCRWADGAVPNSNSRLCSCHFKDGLRQNGPSIFQRNAEKIMLYLSPEKRSVSNYMHYLGP